MCGIIGVYNVPKAAEIIAAGLHCLQYRGADYAGIVTCDGSNLYPMHGKGKVGEVFADRKELDCLHGHTGLGHVRYPTVSDQPRRKNMQPIMGSHGRRPFALAHNGNLTNKKRLRERLPSHIKLSTSMDTEFIVRLIEHYDTGDIEEDLKKVFGMLRGSFTLGIVRPDRLIAIQDKSACHPLVVARRGDSYYLSSEDSVIDNLVDDAAYDEMQEVKPGTMMFMDRHGVRIIPFAQPEEHRCCFERLYFANPASTIDDESLIDFRYAVGKLLEEEAPASGADVVCPIPDSGNYFAIGFGASGRSGTYLPPVLRQHQADRSFIAFKQAERDAIVDEKYIFSRRQINGRRVVIVDDSIVRGTTLRRLVRKFRNLGAREVHARIGTPLIKHPCRYGINMRSYKELIASRMSVAEIREHLGLDSLAFLSLEGLYRLSPRKEHGCFACLNGKYWN